MAAGLEEITKVSASRAWRYKDDGFEDWRPFAESEDKPSARVLDIISQFTTGKRQIGEMKSLTFTEHVVDDLKKFYGKYPIVFFVDPWTIHKIDSFRVALRRVANLSSGEVGHATAIIVWNDFDADIRAERHEIDRKLSSTFEGTVLLPTPASASAETSVTGVLEREVEELRRQIRKHATPRIERTGTKKPMVIASESLC